MIVLLSPTLKQKILPFSYINIPFKVVPLKRVSKFYLLTFYEIYYIV